MQGQRRMPGVRQNVLVHINHLLHGATRFEQARTCMKQGFKKGDSKREREREIDTKRVAGTVTLKDLTC